MIDASSFLEQKRMAERSWRKSFLHKVWLLSSRGFRSHVAWWGFLVRMPETGGTC